MKVRFVKSLQDWSLVDVTLGQVYELTEIDEVGDAHIIDDAGECNTLYAGEYEVVNE